MSKSKVFLKRVGKAKQCIFIKWAAYNLKTDRQAGICPATRN